MKYRALLLLALALLLPAQAQTPWRTFLKDPLRPRAGTFGCPANGGSHPLGRDFPGGLAKAKTVYATVAPVLTAETEWDWAACQEFINRSLAAPLDPRTSVRSTRAPVQLDPGAYVLDRPLTWVSQDSPVFQGAGPGVTYLMAYQKGSEPLPSVLSIDGVRQGSFTGFTIRGLRPLTDRVTRGIDLAWSAKAARSTSACRFERITIEELRFHTGVAVGADATPGRDQVDYCTFRDMLVSGRPEQRSEFAHGFRFGAGTPSNNIGHLGDRITATFCDQGITVDGSSVVVRDSLPGGNNVDFWVGAQTGPTVFENVRSEGGRRLGGGSFSGGHQALTYRHIMWAASHLDPDGYFLKLHHEGRVDLEDVLVYQVPAGIKPKILANAAYALHVHARGLSMPARAADVFELLMPNWSTYRLEVQGYQATGAGGQAEGPPVAQVWERAAPVPAP